MVMEAGAPATASQRRQGDWTTPARLGGQGAAGMEAAASRRVDKIGDGAWDGAQFRAALLDPRHATQQSQCVGMFRLAQNLPDRRNFNKLPRVHDADAVA